MTIADARERDAAIDPTRSLIVQAPAGSGKTTLLVSRYLKLLGAALRPEQLLAITFTRKAALEMRSRVIDALTEATTPLAREVLARDAELGWDILRAPNRLRIQTIDAFAMSLVRRLPITSGFNRDLTIVENAHPLYRRAAERLFRRLFTDDPLRQYVARFLALHDNNVSTAARLIATMLGKRDQWLDTTSDVLQMGGDDERRTRLNGGILDLRSGMRARLQSVLEGDQMARLNEVAEHAAAALDISDPPMSFIGQLLTTAKGKLRASVSVKQGFPPHSPFKPQARELLDELRNAELDDLFADLAHTPTELTHDEADDLVAVCATLTLAALDLSETFAESGQTDFTELLLAARRVLATPDGPTELALMLDYRIRHILVDEFQDTSDAQFRLFERLVEGWGGSEATFFAVGDPMQSIYRFRGADVSLYLHAATKGLGAIALETITLTSNFRSDPQLIDWFNETFSQIMGRDQDAITGRIVYAPSVATRNGLALAGPSLTMHANTNAELDHLVKLIATTRAAHPDESIAILVRSRSHLAALLPRLRAQGIAWQATDIDSLADTPVVSDLLRCVSALTQPDDRLSWFSLLRAPFVGLLLEDLQVFADVLTFTPTTLEARQQRLSPSGRARLARLLPPLQQALREIDELTPRSVIEQFWVSMGGADAYSDPLSNTHAARLLGLIDNLGPHGLDPMRLATGIEELYANDPDENPLQIMTIHKAKGLEFRHVFLPFLDRTTPGPDKLPMQWRSLGGELLAAVENTNSNTGLYQWLKREERAREREELKRLLYVACTRAEKTLHLSAVKPAQNARNGSLLALLEFAFDHVEPAQTAPVAEQTDLLSVLRSNHRLPESYRWQAPAEPQLALSPEPVSPTPDTALDARVEVALGILVHEHLHQLSMAELPDHPGTWFDTRQAVWRRRLAELGVDENAIQATLATSRRQLMAVLTDEPGRWILSAREEAHCEYSITGIDGDEMVDVVLDRTFIHAGERWIIDYKSGIQRDSDTERFVRGEVNRYRPQLERYARLMSAIDRDTPVITALYFTSLPRLVRLDGVEQDG